MARRACLGYVQFKKNFNIYFIEDTEPFSINIHVVIQEDYKDR